MLASNLGLGNDQLQRVAAVGLIDGVVQNANSLEQVSGDLGLAGEVGRIGDDLLGLSFEFHGVGLVLAILHGGLDAGNLAVLVQHLIDIGVKHIGTTVDGGKTSEALRKLTETIERVDVWGLSVTSHRVHVQADAVNGLDSGAGLVDVSVGGVQGHGVADEIASVILKAELVVDLLHGAVVDVEPYSSLARGNPTEVALCCTHPGGWPNRPP